MDVDDLRRTLERWLASFRELTGELKGKAGFRERVIGVGPLTEEEALRLGVTGPVARACGIDRDCRREHPIGGYAWLRPTGSRRDGRAAYADEARAGDVYARFLVRVEEVAAAHGIIKELLDRWLALPAEQRTRLLDEPHVLPENNYTFAVGYAEGFRGDVVYWVMQDKLNGIYRCKIRDPSMLNWPALRQSVLPRPVGETRVETLLADFPVINKSFNLSYAGNDL